MKSACFVALLLLSCAHPPTVPVFKLAPSALGVDLVVEQRLQFIHHDQHPELQAVLEVDAHSVHLAALMLGETAERLVWDGTTLQQQRAAWVPEQVSGERILSDLQLTLWPEQAVRAALPQACSLQSTATTRVLFCDNREIIRIDYTGTPPRMQRAVLHHRVDNYDLVVETLP